MNEQELRHILARNPGVTTDDDPLARGICNPKPERNAAAALDEVEEGKEKSTGRTSVSFTGYRVRLLDPDNFAGSVKDLLDCLRQSHIILDDSPEHIVLHTTQTKVNTRKEERTEIEITYP